MIFSTSDLTVLLEVARIALLDFSDRIAFELDLSENELFRLRDELGATLNPRASHFCKFCSAPAPYISEYGTTVCAEHQRMVADPIENPDYREDVSISGKTWGELFGDPFHSALDDLREHLALSILGEEFPEPEAHVGVNEQKRLLYALEQVRDWCAAIERRVRSRLP